ncbi:MAG: 3-dehydroquinate synthase [Candidatus Nanopelagicaceae bacterium]|nr:3-dehydroquinate synthase [Candidatus Nanopelagicaceae bacterium]
MKAIEVSAERKYQITFTDSWSRELKSLIGGRQFVILTQTSLRDRVVAAFSEDSIVVTAEGEQQKTLANFTTLLEELAHRGLDRNSLIIGIGGGATTDLAGFLAATYMRGIDWVAVPTSIAGMVDAAIGGKTGVNLSSGKNLVGAFHSPAEVIIDFDWLKTLPNRELRAGLAESVKCGFISDSRILELFQDGYERNLAAIIHRSVAVKASVVTKDFRESFEREVLNYGHTLGHAIEQDSNYQLAHGEAVSIGMVFAAEISHITSGLSRDLVDLHYAILKGLDLPCSYKKDSWENLISLMGRDKKRRGQAIRFVSLLAVGKTDRIEVESAKLKEIYEATVGR